MALTIADLLASPDHYLHSFDGEMAVFVPMDRAAYHRSIFLDGRISPAGDGAAHVPVAAFRDVLPRPARTAWIFHLAHCGSTLLARALDTPGTNLVLREPLALRQAALSADPLAMALACATISKRYDGDLPTLVKANVPVNFRLGDIAATDPQAPAILLYATLDDYLLAILRSDNHRQWLRRVTALLAAHVGDTRMLGDGECAAALWLAQMRAFAAALAAMPNARTLDAERFFNAPAETLAQAAPHLGIPLGEDVIAGIVAGPLFTTYSKNPSERFDNASRLARRDALKGILAAELTAGQRWLADHSKGDDPLPAIEAAALG